MPISVTARRTGGPLRCEVELPGGRTLVTDEPKSLGGEDDGPTPQTLVAAGLASCVATTLQMYAARKDWDLTGLSVDVDYDTDAKPRKALVRIHFPADMDDPRRERLLHIASRCPVSRSLAEGHEIVDCEAAMDNLATEGSVP